MNCGLFSADVPVMPSSIYCFKSVFNLPGLGSLIVLSIKAKDTPSVLASVLLLAVFFALIMLIVDLVYAFIDPRIKAKYAK